MRALVMAMLMLGGALQALTLDKFEYKDSASLRAVWQPVGESKAPEATMGADMVRAAKLPCHFSTLKDWRVYWDRDIKVDLSKSEQITVKLKSPDPTAVGQAILYFRSGAGWYRMPAFSVGPRWEAKVLARSQAAAEDSPAGWDKVDHMRIGFIPASKRDTAVELAEIAARSGWPLSYLGSVGGYKDFAGADKGLREIAKGKPCENDLKVRLRLAKAILAKATAEKDPEARQDEILEGRKLVAQAYALVQEPKKDEFRCVWVHHGDGLRALGGDRVTRWKDAVPALKAAGFNAIAPNMLWSGTAFYPSKIVPVNSKVKADGDFLQEIIDAAKPLGMKVHVWKVMWQTGEGWLADNGVGEKFKGRFQIDAKGKEQPWLCPCDEQNREYEMAALLEVAKNYPIDGVHLDYIRYSGQEVSYSPMCRKRFEKDHPKVENWPADCAPGGKRFDEYAEFKRETITSFVREIRARLKKQSPKVELSAAVWSIISIARDSVSQDWPLWAREGLLDWVSTMTYTEDAESFKGAVVAQKEVMGDKTKLYPGMQVTFDGGRVVATDTIVDEIKAVRDLGLGGFTLFEYGDQLHDTIFPYLAAGLTREGDYQLKIRETPAYAKAAVPVKGRDIKFEGKTLLLDDFEDGNLVNNLRSTWSAECDENKLGTTLAPKPLAPFEGGPGHSKFAIGITGHFGKNQAPWPYASLHCGLNPAGEGADLTPFKVISFMAKGDGKNYEVVLSQEAVKDYGYYRSSFKATNEWTEVVLPLKNFMQSGWAAPVKKSFVDVKALQWSPAGMNDEGYELQIDNVKLIAK